MIGDSNFVPQWVLQFLPQFYTGLIPLLKTNEKRSQFESNDNPLVAFLWSSFKTISTCFD